MMCSGDLIYYNRLNNFAIFLFHFSKFQFCCRFLRWICLVDQEGVSSVGCILPRPEMRCLSIGRLPLKGRGLGLQCPMRRRELICASSHWPLGDLVLQRLQKQTQTHLTHSLGKASSFSFFCRMLKAFGRSVFFYIIIVFADLLHFSCHRQDTN